MMSFHFGVDAVNNFEDACNANADHLKTISWCIEKRIYFAPSAFEALFISNTHLRSIG